MKLEQGKTYKEYLYKNKTDCYDKRIFTVTSVDGCSFVADRMRAFGWEYEVNAYYANTYMYTNPHSTRSIKELSKKEYPEYYL